MTTLNARRGLFANFVLCSLLMLAAVGCGTAAKEPPARRRAAAPMEELRGLFVTTSNNTDWPSQAGLHENIQQNEIDAAIIRAKELNCNVIFLQVRAFGDRMHWSTTLPIPEPWAQTLSFGHDPKYDPLRMWIRKAHRAGIHLHAWIDPYRTDKPIQYEKDKYLPFFASADGNHLYLDPTSMEVQKHLLRVIADLLSQYPHKDAPAPVTKAAATQPDDDDGLDGVVVPHNLPNPANIGYAVSGDFRGVIAKRLGKAPPPAATAKPKKAPNPRIAWLLKKHEVREPYEPLNDPGASATDFVRQAYELVHAHQRKFGLSPSEDQWADPNADFKTWLEKRWCHYFIPELYLPPKEFKAGLEEWIAVNDRGGDQGKPLLAPALNTAAIERPDRYGRLWDAKEIEEEIEIARRMNVGQVHFSERALRQHAQGGPPPHKDNVGDKVRKKYKDPTLLPPIVPVPARVDPPGIRVLSRQRIKLEGNAFQWIVRFKTTGGEWGNTIIIDHRDNPLDKPANVDRIEAVAIDRHGNRSDPAEAPL